MRPGRPGTVYRLAALLDRIPIRGVISYTRGRLPLPRCGRVGVAFSEGPKHLPFYENLVKWQLLPLYAHILSVTFTVLPQTHNREAGATTARRRSRWRGRTAEWTDAPFPKECVSVCRARNAGKEYRTVKSPVHELHSRSAV